MGTVTLRCGSIRKKYQFLRFPSFRFCPILEIKNLETSESFIISVSRLKTFTESQINVSYKKNKDTVYKEAPIYACFFLNDINDFLRSFSKKAGALV